MGELGLESVTLTFDTGAFTVTGDGRAGTGVCDLDPRTGEPGGACVAGSPGAAGVCSQCACLQHQYGAGNPSR